MMQMRIIERCGIAVSEIGLGCEGFHEEGMQLNELLTLAREHGVNLIDLYSPDPDMRKRLGNALQKQRDDFIIQGHLCSIWKQGQYQRTRKLAEVKNGFQQMCEQLQTDRIDIGMIHYVDAMEDWQLVLDHGILDYALELKKQGKLRAVGISSHNPLVAYEAVLSGHIDVLMFSINPCYDLMPASEDVEELWNDANYEKDILQMDQDRERLYEVCQKMGVAITVMKAFGGGDLLDAALSPAKTALTVKQCLHYAFTRPAVVSVLVGSHSIPEFKECSAYEAASDEEKDYAQVFASMPRVSWEGHCMYCGHCAPCPKHIDIAMVTKLLNLAKAQKELPETVREHYAVLKHTAKECISCGACEARCPFHVAIRENMKAAVQIFGI